MDGERTDRGNVPKWPIHLPPLTAIHTDESLPMRSHFSTSTMIRFFGLLHVAAALHTSPLPQQRLLWRHLQQPSPALSRLAHPALSHPPEERGFVDGLKSAASRFEANFKEARAQARARIDRSPVATDIDSRKLRFGALALSFFAVEVLFLSASLLVSFSVGISPPLAPALRLAFAAGERTAAAITSAFAFRASSRPLRLFLQLGCAPAVAARASRQEAPYAFLKERAAQCAAIAACILFTLRALERGPLREFSGQPLALLLAKVGLPDLDSMAALVSAGECISSILSRAQRAVPGLEHLGRAWCALARKEVMLLDAVGTLWRGALAPLLRLFFKGETEAPVEWISQLRAVVAQTVLG